MNTSVIMATIAVFVPPQHCNGGAGNTAEYANKYLIALNFSHF
jgi:hypothetical protein